MDIVRIGVIGLGGRGYQMLRDVICDMPGTRVTYICDLYPERVESCKALVNEKCGYMPAVTSDYKEVINSDQTDAILIYTYWETHIEIAIEAMKSGKKVGVEVGGAYTIDDCFKLLDTYKKTGNHCMMLENCCYGREEMMVLNMVRQGIFGETVYCSGGYHHDLRDEITMGDVNKHYRLRNYKSRNCENYPTHELGPIAKVLKINDGNRMLGLNSFATKSRGLNEYAKNNEKVDPSLRTFDFAQGDVVTTVIKCANSENIVLTLDTCLPRAYSRGFTVRGTKGGYCEWDNSVFIDGEHNKFDFDRLRMVNNINGYYEKYEHPIWEKFLNDGVRGGHGGMDWLVIEAFLEYVRGNYKRPPIDTYDTASWMSITPLSELSIKNNGCYVEIPDFTDGQWENRQDKYEGVYGLEY